MLSNMWEVTAEMLPHAEMVEEFICTAVLLLIRRLDSVGGTASAEQPR